MKTTALDILNKYDGFEKLGAKEVDLLTACNIAKNMKELALNKEIIEKKRNDIVIKYAKKDDNGEIISDENGNVKIENTNKFNEEIYELLNTEIDVEIKTISIDKLSDLKISPAEITSLLDIIE